MPDADRERVRLAGINATEALRLLGATPGRPAAKAAPDAADRPVRPADDSATGSDTETPGALTGPGGGPE